MSWSWVIIVFWLLLMCRIRLSVLFDLFVVFVFVHRVRFVLREVFFFTSAVGNEGCAKVLLWGFSGATSGGATFVLGGVATDELMTTAGVVV
jgi:hypothetical protein